MTYMIIPEVPRDFEWNQAKSDLNRQERGLPFELAILLFKGPTREPLDKRQDYQEQRTEAIGSAGGAILFCVYTGGSVRRIISRRPANRKERDAYRTACQN